jgi:hypothetical protein
MPGGPNLRQSIKPMPIGKSITIRVEMIDEVEGQTALTLKYDMVERGP